MSGSLINCVEKNTELQQEIEEICHHEVDKPFRNQESAKIITHLQQAIQQATNSQQSIAFKIQICLPETVKQAPEAHQTFVMAYLLYSLIKTRGIQLTFTPLSKYLTRNKKTKDIFKLYITKTDIMPSKHFFKSMQVLLDTYEKEVGLAACHFNDINIKCETATETHPKPLQIIALRQDTYLFIDQFINNLSLLFSNKKVYIYKCLIQSYSNKIFQNLTNQMSQQSEKENVLVKELTVRLKSYFIDLFIFKSESYSKLAYFTSQDSQGEMLQLSNEQEDVLQINKEMGYFMQFTKGPFQYLSKVYLYFNRIESLNFMDDILPALPNLTQLRINNEAQQNLILPDMNKAIKMMIQHNKLIKVFVLKKIVVNQISIHHLEQLYLQCPYLGQFQINVPLMYALQQTWGESKSVIEKERKQCERELLILLRMFRLRSFTLQHHLDFAKLFINDGYNKSSVIELIDSFQPLLI